MASVSVAAVSIGAAPGAAPGAAAAAKSNPAFVPSEAVTNAGWHAATVNKKREKYRAGLASRAQPCGNPA